MKPKKNLRGSMSEMPANADLHEQRDSEQHKEGEVRKQTAREPAKEKAHPKKPSKPGEH